MANRADVTVRTAEHWLSGRCGLSAEALADLLCSDDGLAYLEGIMERRQTKPAWWKGVKRQAEMATLRREQAAMQKRLAKLESDDD